MKATVSELMCRKMSLVCYAHMLAQDYGSLPQIALQNDTFLVLVLYMNVYKCLIGFLQVKMIHILMAMMLSMMSLIAG